MKIISQLIQETSSDEDVLKFTEATHTRINGRSFVTENSMWWWFIYARFIPTHTHDHSLFLLQKGAYTLTLFFSTNITRLEFRILMIRLIQFYKSRMRSTIQKKIKQITHTNKQNSIIVSEAPFQENARVFSESMLFVSETGCLISN